MVTQFGMSEVIGLSALEGSRTPMFLGVAGQALKEYSEETAWRVDEEVKKILSEAHAKVTAILKPRRHPLDQLSNLLLEQEVIDRSQLQRVLKNTSFEEAA